MIEVGTVTISQVLPPKKPKTAQEERECDHVLPVVASIPTPPRIVLKQRSTHSDINRKMQVSFQAVYLSYGVG